MIIKEKYIIQKPFGVIIKENGDAMEYYRDHPEELWDKMIEDFDGSRIKFEHWCHKNYLGPRGPKGANQSKYDEAMAHFDNKYNSKKIVSESFEVEEVLKVTLKDLIDRNDGNTTKTLQELNEIMSRLQGTDEDNERKAYFKARKMYARLAEYLNKKDI